MTKRKRKSELQKILSQINFKDSSIQSDSSDEDHIVPYIFHVADCDADHSVSQSDEDNGNDDDAKSESRLRSETSELDRGPDEPAIALDQLEKEWTNGCATLSEEVGPNLQALMREFTQETVTIDGSSSSDDSGTEESCTIEQFTREESCTRINNEHEDGANNLSTNTIEVVTLKDAMTSGDSDVLHISGILYSPETVRASDLFADTELGQDLEMLCEPETLYSSDMFPDSEMVHDGETQQNPKIVQDSKVLHASDNVRHPEIQQAPRVVQDTTIKSRDPRDLHYRDNLARWYLDHRTDFVVLSPADTDSPEFVLSPSVSPAVSPAAHAPVPAASDEDGDDRRQAEHLRCRRELDLAWQRLNRERTALRRDQRAFQILRNRG